MLECQVNWMIQVIRTILNSSALNKKLVCVINSSAERDYMAQLHETMKKKIYVHSSCGTQGAASWFRNSKGQVAEIYPGTTWSYWRKTFWLDRQAITFY
jgi:hypothetical protein